MIFLGHRPNVPPSLGKSKVTRKKNDLKTLVETNGKVKSKEFDSSIWGEDDVKKAIWEHCGKKCCYCERKRDYKREPDLEHFRPRAKVEEERQHIGYWWLAYEWSNYLFSCKKCNQKHKKNKFPLQSRGQRAFKPTDDISLENPILIDPTLENPEGYITFISDPTGTLIKAIGLDSEGRGTQIIRLLGLNEGELPGERARNLIFLMNLLQTYSAGNQLGNPILIDKAKTQIKEITSREYEFTGVNRAFFKNQALGNLISTD